jgi:hypothetical protein
MSDSCEEATTPEVIILSKLEWSKLGSSERQWADALQVAKTRGKRLDLAYIEKWAWELDVTRLWESVRRTVFSDPESETTNNV